MKYYKLNNSLNTKEIGAFAQVDDIRNLGNLYEITEIAYDKPINFEWEIPELVMKNKAKPTTYLDVIPFSQNVFLVFKSYFIDFLKEFNIGDFQTWPLKVHHKKEVLTEYLLFHISYPSDEKIVDYSQSEFLIGEQAIYEDQSIGKPVKINNHQEYLNMWEVIREEREGGKLLYIQCTKLVLDFNGCNMDMLRLIDIPFGNGYYVSERLKKAIEEQRFTGMDFIEIEKYQKRIKVKNTNDGTI